MDLEVKTIFTDQRTGSIKNIPSVIRFYLSKLPGTDRYGWQTIAPDRMRQIIAKAKLFGLSAELRVQCERVLTQLRINEELAKIEKEEVKAEKGSIKPTTRRQLNSSGEVLRITEWKP